MAWGHTFCNNIKIINDESKTVHEEAVQEYERKCLKMSEAVDLTLKSFKVTINLFLGNYKWVAKKGYLNQHFLL